MNKRNLEFKARFDNVEKSENLLLTLNPEFKGIDHQTDTYFNVEHGRLKLREGNIENSLINYEREDYAGAKESRVILYRHTPDVSLKEILTKQLGVKVVVKKKRRIYFVENVKIHFDQVEHLGTFIEVEAIDEKGTFTTDELKEQCNRFFNFFGLEKEDIIAKSYSDMIWEKNNKKLM